MKNLLINILYVIGAVRTSFGIIPALLFTLFFVFILIFILFEIAQSFLPFTYVAF